MQANSFQEFLERYVDFLEEAAAEEKEKHAAILSYDPKRMDRANSSQQVINMRLAKMEQEREEEQRKAGFQGMTFREILGQLEGDEKERFARLFHRFEQAIDDIKYFNSKSIAFVQGGLQILGITEEEARSSSYGADGRRLEGSAGASLFEKQV